ncbi:hypothetical protein V7S43_004052 [Phytophthora oleae]|uniref:HSF-type DNA-binding domain-containing protein n=1 Tax=Phytophthora oleae TaxID=2107226 RepID=A0ABD3FY20_9STRA
MLGERDRRDSSTSLPARSATPESAGAMGPPSLLYSSPQAALDTGFFPLFGAKSDHLVAGNNMDVMATRQASLVIQEEPEQEQEFALGSEDKTMTVPAAASVDVKKPEVHVIKRRNVGVPKFLRFLFQILEVEDPDIITWSHEGTAFQIIQPEELASQILPKYFKHNKVSSFQRQLNYFGFKKWTKTQTNICTFSHPFFLRTDKNRMKLIKRKERASPVIMSAAMASNPIDLMNQLHQAEAHFEAHDLAEARSQLPTQQALKRQKSNTLSGATVTFLNSAAAGRRHSTGMLPGSEAFGMAAAAAAAAAAASLPGRKRAGNPAEQEFELEMEARADAMGQASSAQQQFLYLQKKKIAEAKQLSQRYPYQPIREKRQSLPHVLPPGFGNNFGMNMSGSDSNGGFGPRNVVNLGRRRSDQLLTDYNVGGGKPISISQIEAFMSSSGTSSPIFASSVKSDASVVLPVTSNSLNQDAYQLQRQEQQRQHQQQLREHITRQQLNRQQNIYGGGGIYGSPSMKSQPSNGWPAPIKTESSSGWPTSINVSSSSAGSASYPPQPPNHSMTSFKYGDSNVPQSTAPSFQNGDGYHDRKLQQRPMMTHPQQYQARQERSYQQQHEQERQSAEEQPPRDYIDVLLESAGLDDTGNLPPQTSTSESWDEPNYPHSQNGPSNSSSETPYPFMQSQQQLSPMENMPHNPSQRF